MKAVAQSIFGGDGNVVATRKPLTSRPTVPAAIANQDRIKQAVRSGEEDFIRMDLRFRLANDGGKILIHVVPFAERYGCGAGFPSPRTDGSVPPISTIFLYPASWDYR